MTTHEQVKARLFKNPDLKKAYDELQPEFEIKKAIVEARLHKGITQADLAKALGTTQSAVSRMESGLFDPRLSNLRKLAGALDVTFEISGQGLRVAREEPVETQPFLVTIHSFVADATTALVARVLGTAGAPGASGYTAVLHSVSSTPTIPVRPAYNADALGG